MTPAISSPSPPAAPPAPSQAAPTNPSGFSELLSRESMGAEPAAEPGARAQAEGQPQAELDAQKQATSAADEAQAVAPAEAKPGEDEHVIDPAIAEWLAALTLPAPPAVDAEAATRGDLADAPEDPAAAPRKGLRDRNLSRVANETSTGGGAAVRAGAARPDAPARAGQAGDAVAQAVTEQRVAAIETPVRAETPAVTPMALATSAAALASRGGAQAPAAAVHVPTPVQSPQFTQALGVQISMLASEGVQQAEIHLNPADMGPISVRIALDGTQAHVNFGADSAATRQIIEGGLPELAASLRDAGFTLSGGGVHQQARGQGRDGDGPSGRAGQGPGGAPEAETAPAAAVRARVLTGGVDLYA